MAKRGRPRKHEAIVTEPIGIDDMPPEEALNETEDVYDDIGEAAMKLAEERAAAVAVEEEPKNAEVKKGLKVIFEDGKLPVVIFKGVFTGKDINEPLLFKLNRAYRFYNRIRNQNTAKGIYEDTIVIDMNELMKRVLP